MPTTTYNLITVQGELIAHQHQNGGIRSYGRDALGSAVTMFNSSGSTANTYRYKPYGSQLAKSGAEADTWFLWNAAAGYRVWSAPKSYAEHYVRARHYGVRQRAWTSIDLYWPRQMQFSYVSGNPVTLTDPSGNGPKLYDACISAYCAAKAGVDMVNSIRSFYKKLGKPVEKLIKEAFSIYREKPKPHECQQCMDEMRNGGGGLQGLVIRSLCYYLAGGGSMPVVCACNASSTDTCNSCCDQLFDPNRTMDHDTCLRFCMNYEEVRQIAKHCKM